MVRIVLEIGPRVKRLAGNRRLKLMKAVERAGEVDCGTMTNVPANRPARSVYMRQSLRRIGLGLLVIASLGTILALFRAPILAGLAAAWVVNEQPAKADAIVVLGGALRTARLRRRNYFTKALRRRFFTWMLISMPHAGSALVCLRGK